MLHLEMRTTLSPRSLLVAGNPGPLRTAEVGSPAYFGTGSRSWTYTNHSLRASRLFISFLQSLLG
jgi:hypothetical protein